MEQSLRGVVTARERRGTLLIEQPEERNQLLREKQQLLIYPERGTRGNFSNTSQRDGTTVAGHRNQRDQAT